MISLVPTPSPLERMIAAPPSVFLRGVTVPGDRFTSATDGPRDRDGNSGAHAPASHGNRNRGIPIRTLLSGKEAPGLSENPKTGWPLDQSAPRSHFKRVAAIKEK